MKLKGILLRLKRFMKYLVRPQEEEVTRLSTKAKFPPSEELERRIKAAGEAMAVQETKK